MMIMSDYWGYIEGGHAEKTSKYRKKLIFIFANYFFHKQRINMFFFFNVTKFLFFLVTELYFFLIETRFLYFHRIFK